MKKQLFILVILVTFVSLLPAQEKDLSKIQKNLRKHVSYLASDQLEGRRTGEKGATFAAGYVANMFARFRLKGGVIKIEHGEPHPSFMQPFPYISGVEQGKGNLLNITDSVKLSEGEIGKNWVPLKASGNTKLPYTPIVFAGYGIKSEKLRYDDYRGHDVEGKIVLAFEENPDSGNPHSQFGFFNAHSKARTAKEKGAMALILISKAKDFQESSLASLFNPTLGETALPTVLISRELAASILSVEQSELDELLKLAESIGRQTLGSDSRKLTTKRPLAARLKIELRRKRVEAYNVIGVLEGSDPLLKKEVIVIGAHYDHLGRGGRSSLAPNSKDIHHGADDNASGTSALLELARRFSKSKSNKRTFVFLAFGGEEEGLLGSKYFVNNPTVPLANIVAMVNMDMIGRLRERKLTVGGIGTAIDWNKIVKEKNSLKILSGGLKPSDLPVPKYPDETKPAASVKVLDPSRFNLQLSQDGFGPSDHSSFYGKKIPVLFFFTGTHEDYHKPTDTPEKINYYGLERITGFVEQIVKVVDRNPTRPVYKVAKSSAPAGGRRRFNVSLGTIPSYSDSDGTGLVLDGVRKGSAAEKAGVKSGDKIVKIAGKEIRNISDYMFMLGEMSPGKTYEVTVVRNGKTVKLKLVPAARK